MFQHCRFTITTFEQWVMSPTHNYHILKRCSNFDGMLFIPALINWNCRNGVDLASPGPSDKLNGSWIFVKVDCNLCYFRYFIFGGFCRLRRCSVIFGFFGIGITLLNDIWYDLFANFVRNGFYISFFWLLYKL